MSEIERIIQTAIEEWAAIQGGPVGRPHNPTLAHYIATQIGSVHEALRVDAFEFLRHADRRAEGVGDFDAYHSARHALVMALQGAESPAQFLSDEVWKDATDTSIPPGVIRIDGNPYPLVEFEEAQRAPDDSDIEEGDEFDGPTVIA